MQSILQDYSITSLENAVQRLSGADILPAHKDMPALIKKDYEEARSIFPQSPRGAAALLCLCVEKLLQSKGQNGNNLNRQIEVALKNNIIDVRTCKILCFIATIRNDLIHPGTLEQCASDHVQIVKSLFDCVQMVVSDLITKDKQIQTFYNKMPDSVKKHVKADGKIKEA